MTTAVERIAKKLAPAGAKGKGFAELARVCGVHYSVPSHWNRPTNRDNGRGGSIPDRYHRAIIDHCQAKGIPLRKGELVNA